MTDTFIMTVQSLVAAGSIVLFVVLLIVALVDIWSMRKPASPAPQNRRSRVTVIVMAVSDITATLRCLEALYDTKSRRFDVVLIHGGAATGSPKETRRAVKAYKRLAVYAPKKQTGYYDLLKRAYARSAKNDLVLVIDSTMTVESATLLQTTRPRINDSHGEVHRLNVVNERPGFSGVILSLIECTNRLILRVHILLRTNHTFIHPGVAYFMPRQTLKHVSSPRFSWAMNAPTSVQGGTTRLEYAAIPRSILQMLQWTVLIVLIGLTVYVIQLAVTGIGVQAFITSWLLVAVCGAAVILFDANTSVRKKIEAGVCIGFMPILLLFAGILSAATRSSQR